MKVLLVGATGQLGQALQDSLIDHHVMALDRESIDITNREKTFQSIASVHPDIVVNAAAFTNVDQAETDEASAYRVNALGPQNLAFATESCGIPLVHVSTDYVFDGTKSGAYHEFDCPNPQSVYGKSKLAGEEAVRQIAKQHFIVRTAWLYHTVGKNFPKTICRLAKQGEVRVVNDQHGSPTFAPHLAKAIGQLLESSHFGTYHLAGAGETTWFEFTQTLFRYLGVETRVNPITTAEYPLPAPRPANSVLSSLHNPPRLLPPWEDGVREFALQYSEVLSFS